MWAFAALKIETKTWCCEQKSPQSQSLWPKFNPRLRFGTTRFVNKAPNFRKAPPHRSPTSRAAQTGNELLVLSLACPWFKALKGVSLTCIGISVPCSLWQVPRVWNCFLPSVEKKCQLSALMIIHQCDPGRGARFHSHLSSLEKRHIKKNYFFSATTRWY